MATESKHPSWLGIMGACLAAVFGVGLCMGQPKKTNPQPTPTPSMSTSEFPLQSGIQR